LTICEQKADDWLLTAAEKAAQRFYALWVVRQLQQPGGGISFGAGCCRREERSSWRVPPTGAYPALTREPAYAC